MDTDIVMTDELQGNLMGLENMVSKFWGEPSPTINDTITRAKAMLENSGWNKKPNIKPKFKVGDIINSSLSSPQEILEIRLGTPEDFPPRVLPNGQTFHLSWAGELCYVLRHIGGLQLTKIYGVEAIDKDSHLKGSKQFNIYQETWDERQKEFFKKAKEHHVPS